MPTPSSASVAEMGFTVQVSPWTEPSDARLGQIAKARTPGGISARSPRPIRDFDFSAPTDARPYFFNMLKPGAVFRHGVFRDGGIVAGNLRATTTLLGLLALALVLVGAIIVWPLVQAGRPELPPGRCSRSAAGVLRHHRPRIHADSDPDAAAVFDLSRPSDVHVFDRALPDDSRRRARQPHVRPARPDAAARRSACRSGSARSCWSRRCSCRPAIDRDDGLAVAGPDGWSSPRFIVPLAFALGMCFPIGMRLVGRHSDRITAWMWGVNGASGVIASILAVMGSMWLGINSSLFLAAALYALLTLPMLAPVQERRA